MLPKKASSTTTCGLLGSPKGSVQLYDILTARCLVQAINVLGDDGEFNPLLLCLPLKGSQCQVASIGLAARHNFSPPVIKLPNQAWVTHKSLWCGQHSGIVPGDNSVQRV
jgi:hypothetical protein